MLEKYGVHLVPYPRRNINVGDIYPLHIGEKTLRRSGSLEQLAGISIDSSLIESNEPMANISGTRSGVIKAQAGFDFLGIFLNALGAVGIPANFDVQAEKENIRGVYYQFSNTTRDYYQDVFALRRQLRQKFDKEDSVIEDNERYFLVDSVYRSNSITFGAVNNKNTSISLDIDALQTARINSSISVEKSEESMITVSGGDKLAYGVSLYEIAYDNESNQFKLVSEIAIKRNIIDYILPGGGRATYNPVSGDCVVTTHTTAAGHTDVDGESLISRSNFEEDSGFEAIGSEGDDLDGTNEYETYEYVFIEDEDDDPDELEHTILVEGDGLIFLP